MSTPPATSEALSRRELDCELVDRLIGLIPATSGRTSTVYAPMTAEPLAVMPTSGLDDVEDAFAEARAAQSEWAALRPRARAAVLSDFHDLVLDEQQTLLDFIQCETGKARKHAFDEVLDTALVANYYARRGPGFLAPQRRTGAIPVLTQTRVLHQPKGVVGIISPWNYPLSMGVTDGLAAIMAGNAIVQKPDSQTPLTALLAVDLLHRAGMPRGLWQIVSGSGSVIGGAVIDHADFLCFTGSTATGKLVAQQAAARLVGCTLELGGKNAMLVLADADIDKAAEAAVRGCFSSAGQLCVSIERLYLDEAIREEFLSAFLARVEALRLGPSFDWNTDMGSLINAGQLATVREHVEDALGKGAVLLAGGRQRPDLGPYFYEPTVLAETPHEALCFTEETFGPVVSIFGFTSEDDAIANANDGRYGLNASVWSTDITRARSVAARIKAGTVNINEVYAAAWASVDAPMGGMRDSGLNRRHGVEGLLKYTEPQTVAVQRLHGITAPAFLDDERFAMVATAGLRMLKLIGWS
ncbi:succinate-semialdehyde dehydrogenase (NADP(+)) [Nocardia yunnanensis]|uniref:Succinate-semialdehyde dehydrogenase (NADP(+)) n=1 Tax=Nocardia yunnanensis TaxID=2382165 RepID=A0A386ZH99_9NOCA|nr:succinic semialdehyde dehydrogenase [Nocardia yunnanensis]AYF76770.1 succinate-semialdehyde dehydrogenase (NADP(+)) [Nocardia yunnanensis]